ncbi:UPF0041-domain-containing protein [Parathielavia hyrcaniae]|uniref:Mitochondrial pyruvate carrier n=1 Tax=Parathielavia hyrcaniae TaxID=113614 RepID=A0AAN6Q679_9PEZI|nr:UPF0041-domain-containing protein [Parathielavia hyrcaniae]
MSPASNLFRAARPAFRARQFFFRPKQSSARFQSTASQPATESWGKRMWNSPVGLKTVHFWAPVMKWALVLAGVADFARPAEKLSLTQNAALTATGIIWTRWCLIIKPKNYLLAAVNFFLGVVGVVQCTRIVRFNMSQKKTLTDGVAEAVKS